MKDIFYMKLINISDTKILATWYDVIGQSWQGCSATIRLILDYPYGQQSAKSGILENAYICENI